MKKLIIALILFASPVTVISLSAYAAIACYDGAQGRIIGWAYNCESLSDAEAGAIQACRNYGGLAPQIRLHGDGGWGAVVGGQTLGGLPVWGFVLCFESRELAIDAAFKEARKAGAISPKLNAVFFDEPSDDVEDK